MSSLRGADGVDDTAVKFLLRAELKKKKEEEEEEKERKAEEEKHERRMLALNHRVGEGLSLTDAEWSAWRKWATSSSSSAGKRRKRKKRRKKAPKTSSSRSSSMRIRRCGHGCALSLRGSVLVCSSPYCRSGRAGRRKLHWYVLGWFFWCSSRCVPFYCRLARVVQTVQKFVQFFDQLFSPVVVQRQVPDLVRTSVARGDSTGAVLG